MDALAALRCWPVTVTLAGREFTIPPQPASAWLVALLSDEPLPVVPGMLSPADRATVDDLLAVGTLSLTEVTDAERDALEAAGGWRWWEVLRLVHSAGAEWQFVGGELTRSGVDLDRVPFGAVLNAIYVMVVRSLDKQQRTTFDFQLKQPPMGLSEDEYEAMAGEMFADLMATKGRPG